MLWECAGSSQLTCSLKTGSFVSRAGCKAPRPGPVWQRLQDGPIIGTTTKVQAAALSYHSTRFYDRNLHLQLLPFWLLDSWIGSAHYIYRLAGSHAPPSDRTTVQFDTESIVFSQNIPLRISRVRCSCVDLLFYFLTALD